MADGYEGLVVVNYRLIHKVGEGGFGAVFLAEHEDLGRKAAVKNLHPEYARHKEVVERFFREAKAVCAIGHRAIIDVQNFGRLESGEPFYLMEYFDGVSLAEHVERHGPLALERIEHVFAPVVGALAAAHENNIVHRDLKPENIMLRENAGVVEDVKLLDFGIAKLVDSKDMVASRTGAAMGTPLFMAPEQQRDAKNVDFRADVYSFGATLFHAVTGRPPFIADNIADLVLAIHSEPAPHLREFAPGASIELDTALAWCLKRDPNARPETIEMAWKAIVAGLQKTTAMRLGSGNGRAGTAASYAKTLKHQGDTTLGASTSEMELASEGRNLRPLWAAFALVVAAVALVVFMSGDSAKDAERSKTVASSAPTFEPANAPDPVPEGSLYDAAPEPSVSDAALAQGAVGEQAGASSPPPSINCARSSLRVEETKRLSPRKRNALKRRLKQCLSRGEIDQAFYRKASSALELSPKPAVAAPPKPTPTVKTAAKKAECEIGRFSAIYKQASPSESDVNSALRRLKNCRVQLGDARYKQVQTALAAKL